MVYLKIIFYFVTDFITFIIKEIPVLIWIFPIYLPLTHFKSNYLQILFQ